MESWKEGETDRQINRHAKDMHISSLIEEKRDE
jgi:hypothetical protein